MQLWHTHTHTHRVKLVNYLRSSLIGNFSQISFFSWHLPLVGWNWIKPTHIYFILQVCKKLCWHLYLGWFQFVGDKAGILWLDVQDIVYNTNLHNSIRERFRDAILLITFTYSTPIFAQFWLLYFFLPIWRQSIWVFKNP